MFGDVETFVPGCPTVTVFILLADAVAFQRGGEFVIWIAAGEIYVEVFLAR